MFTTLAKVRIADGQRFLDVLSSHGLAKRRAHGSRGAQAFMLPDEPGVAMVLIDWTDRASLDDRVDGEVRIPGVPAHGQLGGSNFDAMAPVADVVLVGPSGQVLALTAGPKPLTRATRTPAPIPGVEARLTLALTSFAHLILHQKAVHAYPGKGLTGAACAAWLARCLQRQIDGGSMDQDTFNLGIRKFLKTVGVGSQREIEQAVAKAMAAGSIAGTETLAATMTLKIDALGLDLRFDGEIALQ